MIKFCENIHIQEETIAGVFRSTISHTFHERTQYCLAFKTPQCQTKPLIATKRLIAARRLPGN